MKNWLFQIFLILSLFSLFGVIWGKMRHVEIQQVYVELPPVYRHSILEMIKSQRDTLLDTQENHPVDSDSPLGENLNSPALSVQQQSTTNLPDAQIKKDSDDTLQLLDSKNTQGKSFSEDVLDQHTNKLSDSIKNPDVLDSKENHPSEEQSSTSKAMVHSESWIHKVKHFFSNLFSSDKAKQRDEIEKEVKRLEASSQTQDGDLPKPSSLNTAQTSELLVPDELSTDNNTVAPLVKDRRSERNIQNPKNSKQKTPQASQDNSANHDLVSSKYLLDNIFK